MKKIFLLSIIIPFMLVGPQKDTKVVAENNSKCITVDYMNENLKKYPLLKKKYLEMDSIIKDIELGKIKIANYEDTTFVKKDSTQKEKKKNQRTESIQEVIPWVVRIPVVVHVVYKNSTENISDTQIQSQIDVLNKDLQMLTKLAYLLFLMEWLEMPDWNFV